MTKAHVHDVIESPCWGVGIILETIGTCIYITYSQHFSLLDGKFMY